MICMQKKNSPYTSLTGCTFLYYEFKRILPVLMSADAEKLLKEEVENNQILQVNSRTSRQRFAVEFKRRYAAVPAQFWREWQHWSEAGQRAGLFYAILKAYKLVFDFHVNVAMKKWNSIDHKLTADDIQMEFNEISAHDAFLDGWSAAKKKKCASCYLTILRQTGLLQEKTDELTPVKPDPEESAYYIHTGEEWFLEACFLYPYEINEIKSHLP